MRRKLSGYNSMIKGFSYAFFKTCNKQITRKIDVLKAKSSGVFPQSGVVRFSCLVRNSWFSPTTCNPSMTMSYFSLILTWCHIVVAISKWVKTQEVSYPRSSTILILWESISSFRKYSYGNHKPVSYFHLFFFFFYLASLKY